MCGEVWRLHDDSVVRRAARATRLCSGQLHDGGALAACCGWRTDGAALSDAVLFDKEVDDSGAFATALVVRHRPDNPDQIWFKQIGRIEVLLRESS
jgi:hypothetical protein